ncbi:sulfotransferase domain-containing protein [Gloeocapsa sp. PCC 7428]|uniref:sulfotransferase domain-containing protein n=1 Tax=Gloeocapsa sp. PCC 7428 TaxID=1173026 RepID=UPI0030D91F02
MKGIKKNYKKKENYSNEIKLLRGRKISTSDQNSVLFFTTRKCASTYMNNCIRYLNEKYLHLISVDLASYIWHYSTQEVYKLLEEKQAEVFRTNGILYGPLRQYIPINKLEKYCIVLMLRDPRDVVVSNYYSIGYSHTLPFNERQQKDFLQYRQRVQQQTVDEYVRERAERFHQIYSEYCNFLIKDRNIKWLRYEDFIQNFDSWVKQLGECFNVDIEEKDINALFELKGGGKKVEENKLNHIRKATPGDHKEKLKKETQDFLNTKFKDILSTLNYD